MYRIRILDAASRELARLDRSTGRRIVERINWLASHLEELKLSDTVEISIGSDD